MRRHRSFRALASALDQTAEAIPRNTAKVMVTAAKAAHTSVVDNTPVDKGKAISNWIVTIGGLAGYTVLPFAPGVAGSTADENRAASIRAANAALAPFKDPDRDIVIQNNLHYIIKLNQGSSRQAPAGFVEQSVIDGVTSIKGARLVRGRGRA